MIIRILRFGLSYSEKIAHRYLLENDLVSKNQKLFSKTLALTVSRCWTINGRYENRSNSAIYYSPEFLKLIAASNGVRKLGPKEGRTRQVAGVRLTWKATGEDTGYSIGLYEMDLPPGKGIPLHSHPYAEVFYVIAGYTDFLRINANGQEEWVRCGPGDTLIAPINALHAFHNRTDKPTRFISSSVYYHEILLETFGKTVDVNDPLPSEQEPTETEADRYLQVLKDAMKIHAYFPQANSSSGLEVLRDIENRNSNSAETVHA